MSAHAAMRTHVLILPYVCGAFVGSLLIVTFLPIAGLWAAAIAAGSSAILGAAIVFAQAKQAGQGVQFPLKQLRAAVAPSSVVIAVALLVLRLLPQGGALGNIAALFLIGLSWVGGAYFLLRRAAAPNGDLTGR